MHVIEAMTQNVVTCHGDTTLDEVARKMWEHDCGAVPVLNTEGKPVGIVTDRDIAMSAMLNHRPLWDIRAATVIQTQALHSCGPHDTIEDCLAKMERTKVRRLPVIDEQGKLAGIISTVDAVALTEPGGRKREPKVGVEHVLGMLRKVATRNIVPAQSITPA
jgi:CBS domain-containing protein